MVRREDKVHVLDRLLEEFEQCVLGVTAHRISIIDHDTVFCLLDTARLLIELTDAIDRYQAFFGCDVGDELRVNSEPFGELRSDTAGAAPCLTDDAKRMCRCRKVGVEEFLCSRVEEQLSH